MTSASSHTAAFVATGSHLYLVAQKVLAVDTAGFVWCQTQPGRPPLSKKDS